MLHLYASCVSKCILVLWLLINNNRKHLFLIYLFTFCSALMPSSVRLMFVRMPEKFCYGIVLDAGSSHTSMFIYKCQHSECHVSSYAGNRGGAARKSDEVLKEVRDKLKTYPFSFKGTTILINYLLEKFIKYSFVGQWLSPGRDTVGALDFGGASTQITFETKQTMENKDNLIKLRLYGRDYQIYTQSFLCYGRDQVLLRLLALLMKTQGSDRSIVHPCYPAGHSDSIKLSSVFDTPCNKRQTPYKPDDDLQIKGTRNYDQCLGNVSHLFSFNKCSYSRCSFDGVFQPNISGNFMLNSLFLWRRRFLFFSTLICVQKAAGITITSPAHLEDAVRVVCNMSFQEVNLILRDHLKDYCADSILLQVLLITGNGFSDLSFPHISFQEKTLLSTCPLATCLSNLLPAENVFVRKTLRPDAWWAAVFLFSALLIASIFFLLQIYQKNGTKLCC
uniref:Ectonucleoside triphosphate diphosphohydrolase 2a, tandem duplicate 1 n=1 Tax=Sinocyclocheilus grahami TaxID=75366 RepID=A0A672KPU4_SINGR